MNLKDFVNGKYSFLLTAASVVLPIYMCKGLYGYWVGLKEEYEHAFQIHQKHNCVVTYRAHTGVSGWLPDGEVMKPSLNNIESLYEPILHFIRTARKSLDIAVMMVHSNCILSEISKANKRGVKVRIINNFHHIGDRKDIQALMKEGIKFEFYISTTPTMDTIMHNKFIVKDFKAESGYLCLGSMNYNSGPFTNYESLVFTSNCYVVEAFAKYFEECWNNICIDNKGLINRNILTDAQMDIKA